MKFYKYAPWIGEAGEKVRMNLSNHAVYLNSPDRFNDPFDFNPVYDENATYKEKLNHFTGIYIKQEGLSKERARRKAVETLNKSKLFKNAENLAKFAAISKEGLRTAIGVCCFSITPENSPMWSHYADQHKGICMEWEIPEKRQIFFLPDGVKNEIPLVLQKVDYADERPVNKMFDDTMSADHPLIKSLLTKSRDWSYENEYRLIYPGHVGIVYYDPLYLTGIIVGYKMPPESIQDIKNFVKKLKVQPKLYEAKLSERSYNYKIAPLL